MNARRLDPLLRRAEERENAAARDLAEKTRALASHEQRLAELSRYASEYAPPADGITSPAQLLNRQAFRERIDDAIARQRQAVEQTRATCDVERARLVIASRDNRVLEKLAASYRNHEARELARREQKELDDLAGRGQMQRAALESP